MATDAFVMDNEGNFACSNGESMAYGPFEIACSIDGVKLLVTKAFKKFLIFLYSYYDFLRCSI